MLTPWKKSYDQLDSTLKSRDIPLPAKVRLVKGTVFPVVTCESWTIKKAECWRIDAFELWCWRRLLRVPWSCNSKTLDTYVKIWLIWKNPDVGKDWRQEEKGMTEDEMAGGHHRLNRHEYEQAPGVGDGQGCLACCSLSGHKELDMTEWLNWLTAYILNLDFDFFFKDAICAFMNLTL